MNVHVTGAALPPIYRLAFLDGAYTGFRYTPTCSITEKQRGKLHIIAKLAAIYANPTREMQNAVLKLAEEAGIDEQALTFIKNHADALQYAGIFADHLYPANPQVSFAVSSREIISQKVEDCENAMALLFKAMEATPVLSGDLQLISTVFAEAQHVAEDYNQHISKTRAVPPAGASAADKDLLTGVRTLRGGGLALPDAQMVKPAPQGFFRKALHSFLNVFTPAKIGGVLAAAAIAFIPSLISQDEIVPQQAGAAASLSAAFDAAALPTMDHQNTAFLDAAFAAPSVMAAPKAPTQMTIPGHGDALSAPEISTPAAFNYSAIQDMAFVSPMVSSADAAPVLNAVAASPISPAAPVYENIVAPAMDAPAALVSTPTLAAIAQLEFNASGVDNAPTAPAAMDAAPTMTVQDHALAEVAAMAAFSDTAKLADITYKSPLEAGLRYSAQIGEHGNLWTSVKEAIQQRDGREASDNEIANWVKHVGQRYGFNPDIVQEGQTFYFGGPHESWPPSPAPR